MRDAFSLTDQVIALDDRAAVTPDRVRAALGLVPEDTILEVLALLAERRAGDVFAAVAQLADAGVDFSTFLGSLADMVRAQLAIVLGGTVSELSAHAQHALESRRDAIGAGDLLRMLSIMTELEPQFRKSGQQRLLLETLLVRCALLDRIVTLEAVLRQLGSGDSMPALPDRASSATPAIAASPVPPRPAPPTAEPDVPPPARSVPPAEPLLPLNATTLRDRWGAVVDRIRDGQAKKVLAVALAHAEPAIGSAPGEVLLRLAEPSAFAEQAVESSQREILAALRAEFTGVEQVRVHGAAPAGTKPRRLTAQSAKADQVATFRKNDAVLGAAIDALDLDLLE